MLTQSQSPPLDTPELQFRSSHPMESSRILLSMMSLAQQGEIAVHENPESLNSVVARGVLKRLISALHYRDVSTLRHSRRVGMLATGMAQQLGWDGRHLRVLEVAALLHDIGKIGVPDNILLKPGKLSPDEAELMAVHHNIGADVLQACRLDKEVIQIVIDSHTYYDVPLDNCRSVGDEIHLGARILAVADAYDSLSNEQVYREGKSHDEVMSILQGEAGTRFDGNVVRALRRWVDEDGMAFLLGGTPETSVEASAPLTLDAAIEASSLCHIFSYLYVLESLYDGFYVLDADLNFVVWNRGAEQLLGRTCSQVLRQPWSSRLMAYTDKGTHRLPDSECPIHHVMATGRPACRSLQVQHRSGQWIEVELQAIPLVDQTGTLQGVAEIFRDVSRSKRNEPQFRELKLAASRDALTSVANRGELEKHLKELLADHAKGEAEQFSVIFLDIDHFKSFNDTHGHRVGDQVLIGVARLLQGELYSGELVSRYGGEEFVILCPSTDLASAVRKAERLRKTLQQTNVGDGSRLSVTVSLGVAEREDGDSLEQLLNRADAALYKAKATGRNRTCTLTSSDTRSEAPAASPAKKDQEGFVHLAKFTTCVASNMMAYKVGGFVEETKADLKQASEKQVTVRMGRAGLFKRWGTTEERQPVEIVLNIGDPFTVGKSVSKRVEVQVAVRALGVPRSHEQFEVRAMRSVELMRCHFAAD